MHDAKVLSDRLHEAVNELTPRERLIIFRRRLNDEGATLEQLGGTLGVSKERGTPAGASRIEKAAG